MLGDPAESYMYGAIYMWQIPAGVIGAILASVLFVPVFYPLQLTSVNKVPLLYTAQKKKHCPPGNHHASHL